MTTQTSRKTPAHWLDAASIAMVAAVVALALWVANHGPTGPIPVHYDLSGQADGWAPRSQVGWMLGGLAAVIGVAMAGLSLYARRAGDDARRRSLRMGQLVGLLSFAGVTGMVAAPLLSSGAPSPGAQMAAMAALFLAIGAFLGRVGPNVAVGVRTPWNYKSRLAWERSNRLAGRLFFLLGLAGLVASPVAPQPLGFTVLLVAVLLAAAASVFESWRVWRDDPDRQPF